MGLIKKINAREILDSRGIPTVEVDIITKDGLSRASVPSGASTGKHEALELRDKDKRYNGFGVKKAVRNVNKIIAKRLIGKNVIQQEYIDDLMIKLDGTENKSRLGANAILAVSIAVCKAGALAKKIPLYQYIAKISKTRNITLPFPAMVVIEGGKHAGNKLDMQEFMILPKAPDLKEALRYGSEVYHTLKKIIKSKYGINATNVGLEGGFAPLLKKSEEALKLIQKAINKSGYGKEVKIGIDAAASGFYKNKYYFLEGKKLTSRKLMGKYMQIVNDYDLISIEDPFYQEDFESFSDLTSQIGKKVQIVGDDLLVTNINRIKKAIEKKSCNTLLLKPNQVGTITETISAAKLVKKHKWNVMASHRSGETEDSFIADLAVGINCGQIKAGAPCRERTVKYNQLLRIEEG